MAFYLSQAGGGGVEINGIGRFYKNPSVTQFTDGGGNEWLRGGTLINSNTSNYPDADKYTDIRAVRQTSTGTHNFGSSYGPQPSGNPFVRSDGLRVYQFSNYSGIIEMGMTSAWNAASIYEIRRTANYTLQSSPSNTIVLRDNGTRVFYNSSNDIYQQTLSTAWNASTLQQDRSGGNFSYAAGGYGLYGNYVWTWTGSTVWSTRLNTAWDTTTRNTAQDKSINISPLVSSSYPGFLTNINSVRINSNGTVMYVGGYGTVNGAILYGVALFTLPTAWDIRTALFSGLVRAGKQTDLAGISTFTALAFQMTPDFTRGLHYRAISPSYTGEYTAYDFPTTLGIDNPESFNDFLRIK